MVFLPIVPVFLVKYPIARKVADSNMFKNVTQNDNAIQPNLHPVDIQNEANQDSSLLSSSENNLSPREKFAHLNLSQLSVYERFSSPTESNTIHKNEVKLRINNYLTNLIDDNNTIESTSEDASSTSNSEWYKEECLSDKLSNENHMNIFNIMEEKILANISNFQSSTESNTLETNSQIASNMIQISSDRVVSDELQINVTQKDKQNDEMDYCGIQELDNYLKDIEKTSNSVEVTSGRVDNEEELNSISSIEGSFKGLVDMAGFKAATGLNSSTPLIHLYPKIGKCFGIFLTRIIYLWLS